MSITFVDVDIPGVVAIVAAEIWNIIVGQRRVSILARFPFNINAEWHLLSRRGRNSERLWALGTCRFGNKELFPLLTFTPSIPKSLTKVQTILAARTYTIYELFTQMGWQHVSYPAPNSILHTPHSIYTLRF